MCAMSIFVVVAKFANIGSTHKTFAGKEKFLFWHDIPER